MADFFFNVWTVFYTIVLAFLLFGITVFVHELGHFIAARKLGLVVKTFSIGFGKAVVQWNRVGIRYKIGWIPFGGYVALPQLDPEGMEKIQGTEEAESHASVSPWKKIVVSVAGPAGNILFAAILAWAIFLASDRPVLQETAAVVGVVDKESPAYQEGIRVGDTITAVNGRNVGTWSDFMVESLLGSKDKIVELTLFSSNETRTVQVEIAEDVEQTGRILKGVDQAIPCLVGVVEDGSPAAEAGLRANDIIIRFNDVSVVGWDQFVDVVQDAPLSKVPVVVERADKEVFLSIIPEYNETYERVMIGVHLGGFRVSPMDQLKSDATMIHRVLQGLLTPRESRKVAENLQGPVGIFDMLMKAIGAGFWITLGLIRLINVNLAILNLLPVPVLDGGHIVFALWEGITRRRVNANVQAVLINACAILLISAMLLITFNDLDRRLHIKKLFGRFVPGQVEQVEQSVPADGE